MEAKYVIFLTHNIFLSVHPILLISKGFIIRVQYINIELVKLRSQKYIWNEHSKLGYIERHLLHPTYIPECLKNKSSNVNVYKYSISRFGPYQGEVFYFFKSISN